MDRRSWFDTLAWRCVDAEAVGRAVDQSLTVGTVAGMSEDQSRQRLLQPIGSNLDRHARRGVCGGGDSRHNPGRDGGLVACGAWLHGGYKARNPVPLAT